MVRHLKKSHNGAELVPDQQEQEQEQQAATNNNDETGLDQEPSKLANTKSDLPNPTSQAAIVPNVLDVSTVKASETTRIVFTGFNDNQDNDDEDDFRFGCDQCWFAAETAVQLSEHVLAKHPIVDLTESDQPDNLTESDQKNNLAKETSEKINPVSDKISNEIIVETVPSSTQTKLVATEVVSSTQTQLDADSTDMEVVEIVSQPLDVASESSEKEQKSTEIVSNTFKTEIINTVTSNEEATVFPNQSSTESMFEDDDETDSRFQCNLCWFASETNEELSNHIKSNHESNLGAETEMEEEKNKTSTINKPAKVAETSNKSPEVVEQSSEAEMEIAKTKTGISCEPQENVQSSNLQTSDIEILSNESESIQISNKLPEIVELLDEDDNVEKDINLTEVFQPKEIDIDSTLTISKEESMIKDGDKEVSEKMDQTSPDCLIVSSVAQSNESVEEPSETVQQPAVMELELTETVQQSTVIDLESTETVQQPTDPLAHSTSFQNVDCQPMDTETGLNNEDPLRSNEYQEDQNMDQEMEVETNQSNSASNPIQVPETSESSKLVPEIIDISSMETTEVVTEVFNEVRKDSELDLASESSQFPTEIDDKMDLFFEAPKMAPESSPKAPENSDMEMTSESTKSLTDKNAETELFLESSEMVTEASEIVTDASEVVTDVSKISDSEKAFSIDCNLCDFSTFEFDKMETHLGWEGHFALGQENLCQHCTYMSATKEDLLEHGKTHFEDFALAAFVCCKCEHISKSQAQIEEHVKEAH